ncbi:peptidoglycan synthetase FtsI [Buchnera aphidicola str. Bp (Baizongia pistaciae)]|uniref:Peptidoglycan D,D-transpeptidase FtsI n=1 Tax=Buchnera aphidicola subsp. Baizongia pistaciae (strain Bp) TaxID=224915 RepID=FTSI_BUCBP|nr:peptidoglycan synthase FtsI [Buchnera aphidicola]Q89AQ0.1 RecName: Full=Peptidoglycan D,D-transpeptidase FtsI; AltName: Full=Penicillin-binding protein 3; Short=PBP-3 [Buchnera aphidicola str. Bp (Baizongia pistaciae)]AAO26936.1 peptidoglycan synthetase FtsI [Buchnera aphidicola str. Bp (Baizongia pistaciae)]
MKYFFQNKKNIHIKNETFNNRITILLSLIIITIILVLSRITFLQIIVSKKLIYKSNLRSLRTQIEFNQRGNITDRLGYPLAINIPVKNICIDPKLLFSKQTHIYPNLKWKMLSTVLSIPLSEIFYRIKYSKNNHFIYLAHKVNPEISEYISQLHIPGIYILDDFKRFYPFGKLTSQLIGFTNIDNEGIEGVEKSFNKLLMGKPGKKQIITDRYGRIIEQHNLVNKIQSHDIILSIDCSFQKFIYHILNQAVMSNKAKFGVAILVNIPTGEILSMVNTPSYDPNNSSELFKNNPLIRNKAITDIFELGSTVKPMIIMKALEKKIITPETVINTSSLVVNKHIIHDVSYHHALTASDILKKSSNTGVSRLALSIPISELIDIYSKFELGKSTNLGLIGERNGVLNTNKKHWSDLDKVTLSFGYGLMATPLQLARIYTTIGRYGLSKPLSIIVKNDTNLKNDIFSKQVFSKKIIKTVINMLEEVAKPGGAGFKAAIKGYRIAVKTGTAKKINSKGKYDNKYVSYIVGFAPVSNPTFCLMIMINEPKSNKYYGGEIAAPIFKTIMQKILKIKNIKPDAYL